MKNRALFAFISILFIEMNPIEIFNHPVLDAYLKMNLITSLMPTTLVPLGILMVVYSAMKKQSKGAQTGGFFGMTITDPLMMDYTNLFGIGRLTATTLVPFAFLLGRDVFQKVMNYYTTPQKGGKDRKRRQSGGGIAEFLGLPAIQTYLKVHNIPLLTVDTLLPVSLLVIVYYLSRGKNPQEQRGGGIPEFLTWTSLKGYMASLGIPALTSTTLLPFVIILGQRAFQRYVQEKQSLIQNVRGTAHSAVNVVADTAQFATDTVVRAKNVVVDTAGNTIGFVANTTGRAKNVVVDTAGRTIGFVANTAGRAKNVVVDTAGRTIGFVTNTAKQAKNVAMNSARRITKSQKKN